MGEFKIHSKFKPTGDQPQAIDKLVNSINADHRGQTLLGVTGSGKNIYHGQYNREITKTNYYFSS